MGLVCEEILEESFVVDSTNRVEDQTIIVNAKGFKFLVEAGLSGCFSANMQTLNDDENENIVDGYFIDKCDETDSDDETEVCDRCCEVFRAFGIDLKVLDFEYFDGDLSDLNPIRTQGSECDGKGYCLYSLYTYEGDIYAAWYEDVFVCAITVLK